MAVQQCQTKLNNRKGTGCPVRCPDCGATFFFVEGEALGSLQINFLCRKCQEEKKLNLPYLKKSLRPV